MAAAALAHGGFGCGRDVQLGSALETTDATELNGRFGSFRNFRSFGGFFFESKVGTAFFADGGVAAARFLLDVAAFGAGRRNGFLFRSCHRAWLRCGLWLIA